MSNPGQLALPWCCAAGTIDLPMVKDRHDPEAAALQKPTNPEEVLAALEERRVKD